MKESGTKANFIVAALLLVAAGVALLAFNCGFLPLQYKPIIFSWQTLLISIGFTSLFAPYKRIAGITLMLLGAFLLLPKLHIDGLSFLRGNGWAIFLIVSGICLLFHFIFFKHSDLRARARRVERRRRFIKHKMQNCHTKFATPEEDGVIERSFVLGGDKEKVEVQNFKGGTISCIFGGYELDLTRSKLAEGKNILEINVVFGGVTLYAPSDWKIKISQGQVLGGFVDNRPQPTFEVDENRVLIIKASLFFGGGEINCR